MSKNYFTDNTTQRLFKSLCAIVSLISLAWLTPAIMASLLGLLMSTNSTNYAIIYQTVCGSAIGIATALMMPSLFCFR